jgi:hypothetical protein
MVGDTATVAPDKAPGFQVYEVAPDPVKVAEAPLQMAVGDAEAVIVGEGFTSNVTKAMLVQAPVAPITV